MHLYKYVLFMGVTSKNTDLVQVMFSILLLCLPATGIVLFTLTAVTMH